MSWNFALASSRSGAPGYAPEDARDLYTAMQILLPMLRTEQGLEITDINFLGASLGALEGAYLSVIDADERKIGIKKFLLVNPPLDLTYAFAKVDDHCPCDAAECDLGLAIDPGVAPRCINFPGNQERPLRGLSHGESIIQSVTDDAQHPVGLNHSDHVSGQYQTVFQEFPAKASLSPSTPGHGLFPSFSRSANRMAAM
jgi:hypothetical protein